ncbi:hypothetical protein Clacol_006223 [Clathrus columnatus]|uniref:UFSP1/2/DUB catalytic domain-containing protein n=1 Tax=Clathrus columnatus TaxID=1419009 RepID=A0AAV5ACC3_9AGAM|nr:hypothetical protein Clacol_006223 [Clathrus columnatus]
MSDIEFLYEIEPLKCQICNASLQPLSIQQRQAHYDSHFDHTASTEVIPSNQNQNTNTKHAKPGTAKPSSQKENTFWYPTQTVPPPHNFTPDVIQVLKHALQRTHAKGLTSKAVLCHSGATHIATEFWDIRWGCGYRNFLMACASLMTQNFQSLYFPLLDDQERPPGVRNLQYWIEDAWANGFDREGADDLKHELVGTNKWIGTAGPEAVIEWIVNYFSPPRETKQPADAFDALKSTPVVITERMPIILQHAGHSRTVVGYEVNKKGETNLLVFDPARRMGKNLRQAALSFRSPSTSGQRKTQNIFDILFSVPKKATLERKRRICNLDKRETKRAKGKQQRATSGDNEIVVIDDDDSDDEDNSVDNLDPVRVVNLFKVNQVKLA